MSYSAIWRILPLVAVMACSTPESASHGGKTPEPSAAADAGVIVARPVDPAKVLAWDQIKKLIDAQQFQEALDATLDRLELAKGRRDEEEWTRALIRAVQLRIGLHGYETAVRFLREEPWPSNPLHRATLDLFYAQAIRDYVDAYQWEIRQRERVESKQTVDLKAWTLDQLYAEIGRAYLEVWGLRESLGKKPVDALSEYLKPNDYPKDVRGTLRDAVTYLWVEHLANTTGWRPEHENDLFRLDWPALIRAEPAWAAKVDLANPEVHPLVKIAAVLSDLEAWHQSKGEREGALEAHLVRLTRLHDAGSDSSQRTLVRTALEKTLRGYQDVPWWSVGMSVLANFQRASGMLVRAHQTAQEGAKRYPDSVGGKRCLFIQKQQEAPDFRITSMLQDGPQKRSIEVVHQNLPALFFRAWAVDLDERLRSARDYNLLPGGAELRALLQRKPDHEWRVDLPPTPDFEAHRAFVTPPMTRKGLYVVAASARSDFAAQDNRILGVNFIVTDLALGVRTVKGGANEVTVFNAVTGAVEPSAEVTLLRYDYNRGHHAVETRRTNRDGFARFEPTTERLQWGHFFLARKYADLALDQHGASFSTRDDDGDRVASASLVYTDRSIYRPLQTMKWKVVAFSGGGEKARYAVLPGADVTVKLLDANGETVASKTVRTNSFGSAAGEFQLPAGRVLGRWALQSSPQGSASFRVEEYKRPTFIAELKDPEGPLRLNRPATFKGEARYYFGLPVVNGNVRWRVTREPVFPWWWGFGGWVPPQQPKAVQVVASGETKLDADGAFKVSFTPEADEPRRKEDRAVTYHYRIVADVTDEGGETRTAERLFRLGWVSIDAVVRQDDGFFVSGEPGTFSVVRTDLNGAPRAGAGSWRILALQQPAEAQMPADVPIDRATWLAARAEGQPEVVTPGDLLQPRWGLQYEPGQVLAGWKDGAQRARGELTHGKDGIATATLPALQPGAYRLRYETKDDFGETFETFRDFVVAGPDASVELPLFLKAERGSVTVGETARVLAHSGFSGQPMLLEVWRSGKRVSRRILEGGKSGVITFPIRDEDRGGFTVSLTMVRDHQLIHLSESVFVPWDDKELKVEFATFRDKIRPGTKEKFVVTVKDSKGQRAEAGAAELLAYMFDESLDYFAPHEPPTVASIYPTRTREPWLRSSLSGSQPEWIVNSGFAEVPPWPALQEDELRFYEDYGIGGPGRRHLRMRESAVAAPMAAPPESRAAESQEEAFVTGAPAQGGVLGGKVAGKRGEPQAQKQPEVELRSNFTETAFWQPQLITHADGSASIEFEVPDSVTGWNVWVHAVTRDLRGGSVTRKTRSVKELMVRPYLPRFLREGDKAGINVVVNNASDRALSGAVAFDIVDAESQKSVLREFGLDAAKARAAFSAEAGRGATVSFPVTAPKRPGIVAFKVTATSGNLSDGELRPVPVLPSRMHLSQSRFVTLHDAATKQLTFADMARKDDPTLINDQLVVTVDAQLFYTAMQALPYLIDYPYECTEQMLNRFVSTGILRSMYDQYPAVAQMAKTLSSRDVPLETWEAEDPNRKMAVEETPWLSPSRGGKAPEGTELVKVLDPRIAGAERDASLAKLQKSQTAIGGFPWFPGGPPSPFMTLYILHGLARAAEYGVAVPKDMTVRAWGYVAQHFREEYAHKLMSEDCCWEFLTFLNYVASSFPDESWTGSALTPDERKQILEYSFKHWKQHSPYLKGYLALTLKRMGRARDASLVWASVMDSAKTTEDQGTFWAPEDRSWLWYNDTIETHAFALRTLMELEPKDARRHGLVQWLLINKKLNHWKSTRATAEVIYALVKYLEREKALGVREEIHVAVGPKKVDLVFKPEEFTGKHNQIVIAGPDIDPTAMSTVTVSKSTPGFAFASATWHFSTDRLPEEERGDFFAVSRRYFKREKGGREATLVPLAEGAKLEVGDEVEVQLSLRTKHAAEYVHLRDPRAAGLEPENPISRYKWDLGIEWYEETRDSGTNFFFEWLPVGEYTFKYRLRVNMAGEFRVGPATVQSMYAPEFNAYSAGNRVLVHGK